MFENSTYTKADLRRWCHEYEEKYGVTTEELFLLNKADKVPEHISNFDRAVWLSFYNEANEPESEGD